MLDPLQVVKVSYSSELVKASSNIYQTCNQCPTGCGGSLSGQHGSFTSPMHPAVYPNSQTCEWMIKVPAGGQPVTLSFTTFNIEGTEGVCNEDVLEVYDGADATARLRGRYCGTVSGFVPCLS